jgi:hypothetical protein
VLFFEFRYQPPYLLIRLVEFLKEVEVKLKLTILGEGRSAELFLWIKKVLLINFERARVFVVCPTPAVQIVSQVIFNDDALIVNQREQCCQGEFRELVASGLVSCMYVTGKIVRRLCYKNMYRMRHGSQGCRLNPDLKSRRSGIRHRFAHF